MVSLEAGEHGLWEARPKVESWRREYNQTRPHSSLGYQTPEPFASGVAA
jgi:putative transposase